MPNDEFDPDELLKEANLQIPDAGEIVRQWKIRTLTDAYRIRPPLQFLVDGLLPTPSLSIVYGGPGSLKSMLLADLCVCVAGGLRWLDPLPTDAVTPSITFSTQQAGVLWIDYDNGVRRTDERFDAMGKARTLPESAPLFYVSMPRPWLDASKSEMIDDLGRLVQRLGTKLVVIDNLGLISGDIEENSAQMAQVMGNLRWLCEDNNTALIVVHHQRKSAVNVGGNQQIRKGETLRGHSSIEAALDLALLVERKDGEDNVAVIPTKTRGYQGYPIWGANFTYEHKPGTRDLETARFYSREVDTREERENATVGNAIRTVLADKSPLLQKDLVDGVRDWMAGKPGGKAPGINKIRGIIKQMVDDGHLISTGIPKVSLSYRLAQRSSHSFSDNGADFHGPE